MAKSFQLLNKQRSLPIFAPHMVISRNEIVRLDENCSLINLHYNLPQVCLSVLATCRSQFLLDRLGRCLKLIVCSQGTSCHEFASQFGLEFFYTQKKPKPDSPACCLFQVVGSALRPDKQLNWKLQNRPSWVASR